MTLTNKQLQDLIEKDLKEGLNNFLGDFKEGADSRTPEKEKILVKNNVVIEAQRIGTKIVGRVENDTPYSVVVELGRRDGTVYQYHKPPGNRFHVGNGARMYTRTADALEPEFDSYFVKK